MKGGGGIHVSGVAGVVLVATALIHYITQYFPTLNHVNHTCALDCIATYFDGARILLNPALVPTLRHHYLHAPAPLPPSAPPPAPVDPSTPVWRQLLDWDRMQATLTDLWKDKPPGVFVDVGASDGEFMSQTLLLERNLGWSGLLLEPDPRAYTLLQTNRPQAWSAPLCVHRNVPSAQQLWMHDLIPDLPDDLQALVRARSKMVQETVVGDLKQGRTILVPCVPLSRILQAANLTHIDMLTIATGTPADQRKITDVTADKRKFYVKTVLVQYPRSYLLDHPYPFVPGYLLDMDRSRLLTKLYWREEECVESVGASCRRAQHYDLVESCRKLTCNGDVTVWTYKMPEVGATQENVTQSAL